MPKRTKIADIFIPTSNRVDCLDQCLNSINSQTRTDFHILLVGLRRDRKITALVKKYKKLDIEYFIQKEKGLISAANEAVEHSNHKYFIRIDDDVVVDKGWYENIIKTFEKDTSVGGVTGPTTMTKEGLESRDLTQFLENT